MVDPRLQKDGSVRVTNGKPPSSPGSAVQGRLVAYEERARFYDVEYDETADQSFLRSLVTDEVDSVLEIPCGAGRNVGWLSRTDCSVTFADLEAKMVERVERRLHKLTDRRRLRAVVADMRHLEFGQNFDLILVPREAFQLLTDRRDARRTVESFREHLSPSGRLVMDLATFVVDRFGEQDLYPSYFDPRQPDDRLIEEWSRELPGGDLLGRSRVQRVEEETVSTEYFYEVVRTDEEFVDRYRSEVRLRKYDLGSITRLLEEGGMKMVSAYRNYRGDPHALGAARIVLVAERQRKGVEHGLV